MSDSLDMSLDDLIKNNKRSGGGGFRGKTRASGSGGPDRRSRSGNRSTPYTNLPTDHVQYPWSENPRAKHIGTDTKIRIANLDYGVSSEDIKELFSEVGDMKRHRVLYDRSGRSEGMAEVVYSSRADALLALKRYNNVKLDGKAMIIEIVETNSGALAAVPPVSNGGFGNSSGYNRRGQGSGGRPRGGGNRGGRGYGRGGGGRGGEPVSAQDLDTDLEKYHSESMQIN